MLIVLQVHVTQCDPLMCLQWFLDNNGALRHREMSPAFFCYLFWGFVDMS